MINLHIILQYYYVIILYHIILYIYVYNGWQREENMELGGKALCQGQKINYERQRWEINDPTSPDYLLGPLYPKTHTRQEGFIFGKAAL